MEEAEVKWTEGWKSRCGWREEEREGGRKVRVRKREVRLGVTCAKEIRPPHSILTDRPGEGWAKPPETHTHLPPSLSPAAITLSLGHHSLCLPLRLYHTLHHPLLPPSPAFYFYQVFSFLLSTLLFCSLVTSSLVCVFSSRIPLCVCLYNFVFVWRIYRVSSFLCIHRVLWKCATLFLCCVLLFS